MPSAAIPSKPHGARQPMQEILSGGHSSPENSINKYYPETVKTPKGHMNQEQKISLPPKPLSKNATWWRHCEERRWKKSMSGPTTRASQVSATKPANFPNRLMQLPLQYQKNEQFQERWRRQSLFHQHVIPIDTFSLSHNHTYHTLKCSIFK